MPQYGSPSRRVVLGAITTALAPAAFAQTAPVAIPALASAFAPTGRLRAVINFGNPVLARRSASGGPSGVSVDLARRLAERLGLPLELVPVEAAGRAVETVRNGLGDIGFFAVDPVRSEGIQFSPPYVQIVGSYLVREGSPFTANDQVDRPGTRIAVGLASAYDLFLTREIRAATLVRIPTSPRVVDGFLEQGLDVAAGVRQQLEADMRRLPGLRLLPGQFMVINQAMGMPANRDPAAHQFLFDLVEEAKASGFIAAALARHGVEGASVAPPGR